MAGDAAAERDDELPANANGDCARARYALMSPGGAEEGRGDFFARRAPIHILEE